MKTIFIIIALLITYNSYSQIPEIVWQQCYGSPEDDKSYGIIADGNRYLIVVHIGGYDPEATNYHGLGDIWVLNTDTIGNIFWEKCYGGSNGDVPQKILKADSDYFIYGYTYSTDGDVQSGNNGYSDLWVLKIDQQGEIIWENTYGCSGIDDPRDLILTPDSGFVMIDRIGTGGGDVTDFYGIGDVWMCKCDSLGNIEWEKTLGNQGLDNGISMMINGQGNIMMIGAVQQHGGMVECYPDGAWGDVWLVELDMQGNIVSQHCYGGSDYEYGVDIEELDDGYIFVANSYSNDGDVSGHHGQSGNYSKTDFWVVKINDQGDIVWENSFGGYDYDDSFNINLTLDGVILLGTTYSNDGDVSGNHSNPGWDTDIWAVKLDNTGEIEWQHCYGGWGSERLENPHTILKKSDYDYVIASSTDFSPSYDVQCATIIGVERDAWIFEIKDCDYYAPGIPETPTGPDTICSIGGQGDEYSILPADKAWYYEWNIEPGEAGTITGDSLVATVSWSESFEGTAVIKVKSINDCGESEWSQPKYIQAEACVGIDEITGDGFKMRVYPNPAKDYIVFELKEYPSNSKIQIVNIFGEEVETIIVKSEKTVWDTRQTKNGIYFYRVELEGEDFSRKIVIQK